MLLAQQKLISLLAVVAIALTLWKIRGDHDFLSRKAVRLIGVGWLLVLLGNSLGLLGSIGFLGDGYKHSVFVFCLESIVGYLLGWTLIIWGAALCLPRIFSLSAKISQQSKLIGLYQAITRLAGMAEFSPVTFARIAGAFLDHFDCQAASLHMIDSRNRLGLYAAVGLTEEAKNALSSGSKDLWQRVFDTGKVCKFADRKGMPKGLQIDTANGPVQSILAVPVAFGAKAIGVLTFYSHQARTFSDEQLRAAQLAAAELASSAYREGVTRALDYQRSFRDLVGLMLKSCRTQDNLNTTIIRLAKALRHQIKFESLQLYLPGSGPLQQLDFNLPSGGRVIVEKGYFGEARHRPVNWVLKRGQSLRIPSDKAMLGADFLPPAEVNVVYYPVYVAGQRLGVLALSIKTSHRFSSNDIIAMEAAAITLGGVLQSEQMKEVSTSALEKIGLARHLLEELLKDQPTNQCFRQLAKVVVEYTPSTFCRIMLLDSARTNLQTVAIYQRRHLLWEENAIGSLPLVDLYTHRKAIASGKPVVVDGSDRSSKMSEVEASLLLPRGVAQCLIVPLVVGGRAVGLMTIGENRNPERNPLGLGGQVFAELMASIVSLHVSRFGYRSAQTYDRKATIATTLSAEVAGGRYQGLDSVVGLSSRLNGPLAGIMATCEFIREMKNLPRDDLERHLEVIWRNAEKIRRLSQQVSEFRSSLQRAGER